MHTEHTTHNTHVIEIYHKIIIINSCAVNKQTLKTLHKISLWNIDLSTGKNERKQQTTRVTLEPYDLRDGCWNRKIDKKDTHTKTGQNSYFSVARLYFQYHALILLRHLTIFKLSFVKALCLYCFSKSTYI